MATRKGSNAAAKSGRDGSKAVAHARSSARSGVVWWVVAGGIVAVTTALVVLLAIAKSTGGQRTSQTKGPDSLGEFFSEWQVSLSEDNIGALRAGGGKVVRVFVNGTQRNGNPGAIMLGAHDEIAVLYDRPQSGETIPRN